MERSKWMYLISRLSLTYIDQVKKLVDTARKHTLCLCSHRKNKLVLEGGDVQSHYIKWGFIEEYVVWRFHAEVDAIGGASGGNSSSSRAVNANHGGEPSSSSANGRDVACKNADVIR